MFFAFITYITSGYGINRYSVKQHDVTRELQMITKIAINSLKHASSHMHVDVATIGCIWLPMQISG